MINATMTTMAATRPSAMPASAGAAWRGEIAGYGACTPVLSLSAHRIRPTDAVSTPLNGRDYVATKQGRPPRGEPR